MIETYRSFGLEMMNALFSKSKDAKHPLLCFVWLAGLYGLGIFFWGKFLSWGTTPLDFHDWAAITMPRLDMLRDAFQLGVFPFHALDTTALHEITDRFLVLPDVITTPQTLLLLFVNINTFVIIDILLHYTLGMLGLIWLRQKKSLSLIAFTVLFILFNFNGYILAHYAVGHFTWNGYFLYPIVMGLMFEFTEGLVGWKWVCRLSLVLFYIVLVGGQHHFVWLILFILPFALTSWKRAKWILVVIFIAGLLSAVRFIPPVLALSYFAKKAEFNFVLGYPSIFHLLQSMILPKVPVESPVLPYVLNTFEENFWEFNYYIGLLGAVFVIYFGVWRWFGKHAKEYFSFILPAFFVLFLSLGSNYWLIRAANIPLFASERVASRMISVPMTLLILLATIFFQRWLDEHYHSSIVKMVSFLFLALVLSDLWANLKLWRVSDYAGYFKPVPLNLDGNSVANHADPIYYTSIAIGLGITLATAIFLAIMTWHEHQHSREMVIKVS